MRIAAEVTVHNVQELVLGAVGLAAPDEAIVVNVAVKQLLVNHDLWEKPSNRAYQKKVRIVEATR